MKLLGLNRVELLVHDADRAAADLSALFGGLEFAREPAEGVLDCRVDWRAGIEIVHPESETHPVGRLLRERGEHVFTVVFEVEDIEDAKRWVTRQGFEILYEFDDGTDARPATIRQLSIAPDRTHGMLVTLLERVHRD
ncbi:MAG: hypothetical protein KC616_14305 [Myxococcales bacterium]|nr:hypothetical protein [Myxococcales bacterium]